MDTNNLQVPQKFLNGHAGKTGIITQKHDTLVIFSSSKMHQTKFTLPLTFFNIFFQKLTPVQ